MKQKIKNFLFKKRIKILKSKKGFSLLEVLVAVAIIGIITAIAVPSYTANRKEAAKVAGTTSISNIYKAFQNCLVLKSFADCNSLGDIGITCPDCTSSSDDTSGSEKFCAHIEKSSGGKSFLACISVDLSTNPSGIKRTMGGTLLDSGTKICVTKERASGAWPDWSAQAVLKNCNSKAECGADSISNPEADGDTKVECQPFKKDGKCVSNVCT